MTNTLPQTTRTSYRLSNDLQEAAVGLNIRPSQPDEAEREEVVLKKLGARGWGRLIHFRNYYSAGWGECSAKPLSPRALETFYRFLEKAQFPANTVPSIFLTDGGTLELCWEDAFGKAIQFEFTATGIEFFLESRKIEGVCSPQQAAGLANELSAT